MVDKDLTGDSSSILAGLRLSFHGLAVLRVLCITTLSTPKMFRQGPIAPDDKRL
jgi:hypothetical protein